MGLKYSIETVIFTFIAGGVIALIFMLVRKNVAKRFKYLYGYFKNCIYCRKVQPYNFGGGSESYFRFSFAITAGFLMAVINGYFNVINI